jgi:hypothetical protein
MVRVSIVACALIGCAVEEVASDATLPDAREAPPATSVRLRAYGIETATARVDGLEATIEGGGASWRFAPALVGPSLALEIERDGIVEAFSIDLDHARDWVAAPAGSPIEDLHLDVARQRLSGECQAYPSFIRAHGSLGIIKRSDVEFHTCGPFAPSCVEAAAEREAFIESARSCAEDRDCTVVRPRCGSTDACCSLYLRADYDQRRFMELDAFTISCSPDVHAAGFCGCDCTTPPRAACIGGRCTAAPM